MTFKTRPLRNKLGESNLIEIIDDNGAVVAMVMAQATAEVAEWMVGLMNKAVKKARKKAKP